MMQMKERVRQIVTDISGDLDITLQKVAIAIAGNASKYLRPHDPAFNGAISDASE